jgi:hypothetical protein
MWLHCDRHKQATCVSDLQEGWAAGKR